MKDNKLTQRLIFAVLIASVILYGIYAWVNRSQISQKAIIQVTVVYVNGNLTLTTDRQIDVGIDFNVNSDLKPTNCTGKLYKQFTCQNVAPDSTLNILNVHLVLNREGTVAGIDIP